MILISDFIPYTFNKIKFHKILSFIIPLKGIPSRFGPAI